MSSGDKLVGIKTIYKGMIMRSKLEAKFAMFLDALEIKWKYEPQTFVLSNGITYIPDFYLTELNMWIEVKGNILEHNKLLSTRFCNDNKTELLLISNIEIIYYHFDLGYPLKELSEDNKMFIGKCSKCNSFFFCPNEGSYHCRKCGTHEGDHDIKYSLQSDIYCDDRIDFYDSDSIKKGLNRYGVTI